MHGHTDIIWIKAGIACGLLVSVIYPALILVPMPSLIQVLLVMAFGPLLSVASAGLYFFIKLHEERIAASIALISNIIAGVLVTTMLLVQMAIRSSVPAEISPSSEWIWQALNRVHHGLDVSWDLYIFLGTLLFAISAFSHPKLGKTISVAGVAIAVSLIVLNAISFPTPPASAGLFDVGPLVGLWYLIVTISIIKNFGWAKAKLADAAL